MTIVVMKFGGSCLKDSEAFDKVMKITNIYKDEKKVYVASAFNGITDLLLKVAHNLDNDKEVDKYLTLTYLPRSPRISRWSLINTRTTN